MRKLILPSCGNLFWGNWKSIRTRAITLISNGDFVIPLFLWIQRTSGSMNLISIDFSVSTHSLLLGGHVYGTTVSWSLGMTCNEDITRVRGKEPNGLVCGLINKYA